MRALVLRAGQAALSAAAFGRVWLTGVSALEVPAMAWPFLAVCALSFAVFGAAAAALCLAASARLLISGLNGVANGKVLSGIGLALALYDLLA